MVRDRGGARPERQAGPEGGRSGDCGAHHRLRAMHDRCIARQLSPICEDGEQGHRRRLSPPGPHLQWRLQRIRRGAAEQPPPDPRFHELAGGGHCEPGGHRHARPGPRRPGSARRQGRHHRPRAVGPVRPGAGQALRRVEDLHHRTRPPPGNRQGAGGRLRHRYHPGRPGPDRHGRHRGSRRRPRRRVLRLAGGHPPSHRDGQARRARRPGRHHGRPGGSHQDRPPRPGRDQPSGRTGIAQLLSPHRSSSSPTGP